MKISHKQIKKRQHSRRLAVQAIYSVILLQLSEYEEVDNIIDDMMLNTKNEEELDSEYFASLVMNTVYNGPRIDSHIKRYLDDTWKLNRISMVVQSILRVAAYEILFNRDISPAIIIDEYIEIAKQFNHEGEVGFINSVLDSIFKSFLNLETVVKTPDTN